MLISADLSCIRRICKAGDSKIKSLRKQTDTLIFVITLHIVVLVESSYHVLLPCIVTPSCGEADYFYVVQSGSFQVSKTEAAASAEKILDEMRRAEVL